MVVGTRGNGWGGGYGVMGRVLARATETSPAVETMYGPRVRRAKALLVADVFRVKRALFRQKGQITPCLDGPAGPFYQKRAIFTLKLVIIDGFLLEG